jgi:hypothetical protein
MQITEAQGSNDPTTHNSALFYDIFKIIGKNVIEFFRGLALQSAKGQDGLVFIQIYFRIDL